MFGLAAVALAASLFVSAPAPTPVQDANLGKAISAVRTAIDQPGFSGAVVVLEAGEPLLAEVRGQADQETGRPNALTTRFNIASVGKMLTGVAYVRLEADRDPGGASFRDQLVRALMSANPGPFDETLTMGDLMTHRSNIGGFLEAPGAGSRLLAARSNADIYAMVLGSQSGQIGRRLDGLAYNNSNAIVVGEVAAALSGTTYEAALQAWVLDPAEGRGAIFARLDDHSELNLARPYVPADFDPDSHAQQRQSEALPVAYPRAADSPLGRTVSSAAGGLYISAPDLAAVGAAMLDGRLLSSGQLAAMCESILPIPGRVLGYSCTGTELAPGVWRWGHSGGAPGVSAHLAIYPSLGVVLAVVSNHDGQADPILEAFETALVRRSAEDAPSGGFVLLEH